MSPAPYTELQVTTPFSFLRGASHAEELVAQAMHLGLSGLAVTDRNSLAGAAAKEAGLKCIIGARLDLVESPSQSQASIIGFPRAKTRGPTAQEEWTPGSSPGQAVTKELAGAPSFCSLLAWPTDRAAYGRLTRLMVKVPDRPGSLAELTRIVASAGRARASA